MKTILAFLILFLPLASAQAGDIFLDINGTSKHSKDTYLYRGATHEYNSRNAGLGLTAGLNKHFEASVGFYDNSYDRLSAYASVTLKHELSYRDFRVTPGISVGLATGYSNTPVHAATLQPLLSVGVRATWRGVGFTVGYFPPVNTGEIIPDSVITLQANVQLKNNY